MADFGINSEQCGIPKSKKMRGNNEKGGWARARPKSTARHGIGEAIDDDQNILCQNPDDKVIWCR